MKLFPIPTGYLFVDDYSKGQLETLSIGDYGKAKNIKADFLGFNKEIEGVANGYCMPLSEKWVITVSTQFGCIQKCKFCSCPNIPFKGNASFEDLKKQFYSAIKLFPNVKYTDRLNLHYARIGEPAVNPHVFEFTRWLYVNKKQLVDDLGLRLEVIHPVLTTSLPKKFKKLEERIFEWIDIKNNLYNGQAGLQFSINSTDEDQRTDMFNDGQLHLKEFAKMAEKFPEPLGRKYCLNFAYATSFKVDPKFIKDNFDSNKFMVKITPIHNNDECRQNGIETVGGYDSYLPYKAVEEGFKQAGFDTLVFVPSMDEEDGLVTCGNAVISSGDVKTKDTELKIHGTTR
jgi:23S rRNA (adenine2503-C2)-methyltransferase